MLETRLLRGTRPLSLLLAVVASSLATAPARAGEDEREWVGSGKSVVYGRITFSGGKRRQYLTGLHLRRYTIPFDWQTSEYEARVTKEGYFYSYSLPPGTYQIVDFGCHGMLCGFGDFGRNFTAFRIERAGVYFLGAFDCQIDREEGGFRLTPLASGSEMVTLAGLLEVMKKGPWKDAAGAKLSRLRRIGS